MGLGHFSGATSFFPFSLPNWSARRFGSLERAALVFSSICIDEAILLQIGDRICARSSVRLGAIIVFRARVCTWIVFSEKCNCRTAGSHMLLRLGSPFEVSRLIECRHSVSRYGKCVSDFLHSTRQLFPSTLDSLPRPASSS